MLMGLSRKHDVLEPRAALRKGALDRRNLEYLIELAHAEFPSDASVEDD